MHLRRLRAVLCTEAGEPAAAIALDRAFRHRAIKAQRLPHAQAADPWQADAPALGTRRPGALVSAEGRLAAGVT